MTSKNRIIVDVLKKELQYVDEMWNSKEKSHAYIIGYLQGIIKGVINDLEQN